MNLVTDFFLFLKQRAVSYIFIITFFAFLSSFFFFFCSPIVEGIPEQGAPLEDFYIFSWVANSSACALHFSMLII